MMFIVNIKGGLGNQLFQYAFAKQLAAKNKELPYLDISFFDNEQQHRSYNLDKFKLVYQILPKSEVKKYKIFQNPLINKCYNLLKGNFSVYIERKVESFNPSFLTKKNGYFEGYWQSEKYFKSIRNVLLSEIVLKEVKDTLKPLIYEIKSTEAVSIHIRKMDYLQAANKKIYAECTPQYYLDAISEIIKVSKNAVFYIFSDDFEWVKNNLDIRHPHQFVNYNTGEEDLYLMSLCKHNIIANSTFSWWGAWLNQHEEKVVIAPKTWFNEHTLINNDIFPESWITLNN